MFVYLKTPDMGMQGQNKAGCLIGGEVRAREQSFLFLFLFFLFFLYHVFVVKVQETISSASYEENNTIKQFNDLLHLVRGQTNTTHP